MSSKQTVASNTWLSTLLKLKPARWQWSRALRAGITVGLPFAIGLALGDVMTGMWIAMGTLMMSTGETSGAYGGVLRRLAIGAPLGAAGYLAGYLTGLPWAGTVVAMAVIAFGVGLLSRHSAALSIGGLQLLLTASIAVGVPAIAPFWEPALLYLVGAAAYCAWVGVEALVYGQRPRRERLATLLSSLANLAEARASGQPTDAARREAAGALAALADDLPTGGHPSAEVSRIVAAYEPADMLFATVLATDDPDALKTAARQLRMLAVALADRGWPTTNSLPGTGTRLDAPLHTLASALAGAAVPDMQPGTATPAANAAMTARPRAEAHATTPDSGRNGVTAALALALCIGIAYATHWFNHAGHWFWVPLTVGLVMKPDLGSIFARAVLRSLGAIVGVAVGALILTLVPKSYAFVLIMALLAGLLPWAMQRSYALQGVVLTPLVLMLVDVIVPGSGDADFAIQRLTDTVVGGVIVVIFGYLLWPRHGGEPLGRQARPAQQAVSDHLLAVLEPAATAGPSPTDATLARRHAYRQLATCRANLQKSLADPPPACTEAAARLHQADELERCNDAITRYTLTARLPASPQDREALAVLARALAPRPATGSNDTAHGTVTGLAASSPVAATTIFDDPAAGQLAAALAGRAVS